MGTQKIAHRKVITTVKFNVLKFRTPSCLPKRPRQTADPDQTASEEVLLEKQSDQGPPCAILTSIL